jgi:Restriction endonuclease BglII
MHLQAFSYRFAEQVLNSRLALKQEVEEILTAPGLELKMLSRPTFNQALDARFTAKGWERQPLVFSEPTDPGARMDFLKERVGVEIGFGHGSFLGIDLLKFQVASYSALDRIDVGIYILTTRAFQTRMKKEFALNWEGSLTYEKVIRYLPHFKSAIQIPLYVIGIDS